MRSIGDVLPIARCGLTVDGDPSGFRGFQNNRLPDFKLIGERRSRKERERKKNGPSDSQTDKHERFLSNEGKNTKGQMSIELDRDGDNPEGYSGLADDSAAHAVPSEMTGPLS